MKRTQTKKLATLAIVLTLFVSNAQARYKLTPLPSIRDYSRGSGLGLALGGELEFGSPYSGSDNYDFELTPIGGIHWREKDYLIYLEQDGIGWRGLVDKTLFSEIGMRYDDGLSSDDTNDGSLDGIEERDSHLVGYIEARRALDKQWQNWLGVRVEAGLSDYGMLGVLSAGHLFKGYFVGTGTEIIAFASFGTSSNINKDFGVSATDAAASSLTEIELSEGYRSAGLKIVDRSYLVPNLQILWEAGAEIYGEEVRESSIAASGFEFDIGFSLLWQY